MGRVAAFFDMDRTLIDVNSALLFAKHEYKSGRISGRQMATATVWTALYHLSLLDMESAYNKAVSHYQGTPSADLESLTFGWFEREVARRLQPGGQRAIDFHRKAGHPLVLLTNSSSYMAEIGTRLWELDAWIANIFPTDEHGCLLGHIESPMCYGAGKVTRSERWAADNEVDVDNSYFYTDSLSDLPMLERVKHPVVVNPDPRLRRVARRRGWPIEDWR